MKKLVLTLSFATMVLFANSQTKLYQSLKKIITETHPEIILENKLIAFNVWSIEDIESRETNKNFEKTYDVYQHARLKGGSKGMVVLSVNTDDLSSTAVIAYTKDGIKKMIPVKLIEVEGLEAGTFNSVFDSNGNAIYKNLSAPNVFSSINHLITR